jgi:hypothetical protein
MKRDLGKILAIPSRRTFIHFILLFLISGGLRLGLVSVTVNPTIKADCLRIFIRLLELLRTTEKMELPNGLYFKNQKAL